MSCGNCGAVPVPGSTICPECLLEDFQNSILDESVLDRYTDEEILEINQRMENENVNEE